MMRLILLLMSLLLCAPTLATEVLPPGCSPLVISDLIALTASKPRLILVHNLSNTTLWLIANKHELTSALNSELWTALHLDDQALTLNCIESKPGHEQEIACENRISVCEWAYSKKPDHFSTVFWAAENMELAPLIAYLGRRGVILPSSVQ